MDYQKLYDSIINKAKSENRKKFNGVYYEKHHILPKCMGGGNEKENLVLLTAKEHYVCHKLLFRVHPNNKGIAFSLHSMIYTRKDKRKLKLSSREYEEARIIASIYSEQRLIKMTNKTKEEKDDMYKRGLETKKRNKEAAIKNGTYVKEIRSEESRKKSSESLKGKNTGKQNPEHIKKAKENRRIKIEEKLASGWKPEKRFASAEAIAKRLEARKRNIEEKIANGTYIKKTRSEESNRKQSESMRGKTSWNKGIKMSAEYKLSISGENHQMFGKKLKLESIIKREETRKKNNEEKLKMGIKPTRKRQSKKTISKRIRTIKINKEIIRQERAMMIF